jgi:predicted RNA-binding protein
MCLAKAYVHSPSADTDDRLVMENVTRVEVDGDKIRIASLLGEAEELLGRILSVNFADGRLILEASR